MTVTDPHGFLHLLGCPLSQAQPSKVKIPSPFYCATCTRLRKDRPSGEIRVRLEEARDALRENRALVWPYRYAQDVTVLLDYIAVLEDRLRVIAREVMVDDH